MRTDGQGIRRGIECPACKASPPADPRHLVGHLRMVVVVQVLNFAFGLLIGWAVFQ